MSPIKESALNTFRAEAEAVQSLAGQLTDDFEKAVRAILATHGKVIVTGMGKSGLVGRKIAATLASTVTYGAVSCWMYVIGMGAAIYTTATSA